MSEMREAVVAYYEQDAVRRERMMCLAAELAWGKKLQAEDLKYYDTRLHLIPEQARLAAISILEGRRL